MMTHDLHRLSAAEQAQLRAYIEMQIGSAASLAEPPLGLDRYLATAEDTFSRRLRRLIRESGASEVEIYTRARVDRRHFSKIRSDATHQPRKTTVVAFALALRLSADETQTLLASAGYTLSSSSHFDLIVRFFIEHGIYDLLKLNDALFTYNQPLLPV